MKKRMAKVLVAVAMLVTASASVGCALSVQKSQKH